MQKYWFKNKRYGWGWRPASWQGWIVMLLYVIALVVTFRLIDIHSHSNSDTVRPFVILTFFYTVILVSIAYLTGEKPKWRWGE